jgi:di/tricarboxylate transporter
LGEFTAVSDEAAFVFVLIGVAAALMASNKVRFDIVALLVLLSLMLSGVLTVDEALSGFGSSVVILVAGLLIIGEMLSRTGVARAVGDWILKKGGTDETRLLILIMVGAAVLGSVMSSTAVVAIFIPIVLRIAADTNLNASRMLIPMSYAALISGMLTLIATTPNLVVHEELMDAGYEGFGFFSFSLIGIAVLAVAVAYILFVGRRLLPGETRTAGSGRRGRTLFELWEDFRVDRIYNSAQVGHKSSLVGKTIAETELESSYRVRILGIMRRTRGNEERIATPGSDAELHAGDVLLVISTASDFDRMMAEQDLSPWPITERGTQRWLWEMGAATVLIHPESGLIGKSLRDAGFRSRHDLHVIGLRRAKQPVADFEDVKLAASDSLFLAGSWSDIHQLQSQTHDFVVLEVPAEHAEIVPSYRQLPIALGILIAMVALTLFDVVPLVAAVIMAALAAVFTRCLTMEDAYRSIHWSSIVLIAGMLPLADALDKTGGTRFIVDSLMNALGDAGPYTMLSLIFVLTALLGLVLSNTAAAVLVAPIAIYTAKILEVSPYPFAVAVLIAASAAYATPISTPVVTLVVDPGRYKFSDFVKVGVPLLFLTYLVTLVVAPLIFPFYPS